MLIVISPAKTLDYETPVPSVRSSQPRLLEHSEHLIARLRKYSVDEVASLMSVSENIAALNVARFSSWTQPFNDYNARPAIYAFKGDVYTGFEVERFSKGDIQQAQKQLRILSGLYGVLRPLDLMQPYRLEMGTRLKTSRGVDLYQYWGGEITAMLNADLAVHKSKELINLASNEYFRSVVRDEIDARIVTPVFHDEKNGKFKVVSFYAKKARGLMAAWIIQNKITSAEKLAEFNVAGYRFSARDSTSDSMVFRRLEKNIPKA